MPQTIGGREIDRGKVTIDGTKRRVYYDMNTDDDSWPSVSTILDARPTPDKDAGIAGWKRYLRSNPDKPSPEDVKHYKGWRGTLTHYKCFKPLTRLDRDLASQEEVDALAGLENMGEYRHQDAITRATDDISWAVEQFTDIAQAWHIGPETVRAVEQYVVDDEYGYAGQLDLAWTLPNGETVVGDVKTSKAGATEDSTAKNVEAFLDKKWPRNGLQLAAYANAVPFDVDRLAVIWLGVDTETSAMVTDEQWPADRNTYETQFTELTETFHKTVLDDYQSSSPP